MTESEYETLVRDAYRRIEDAFEDVDSAVVDLTNAGDTLHLMYAGGLRLVINTQRPARQLWAAARATAHHFNHDAATGLWQDDRGRPIDLYAFVEQVTHTEAGLAVRIARPAAANAS